jgi:hypothetical protein
MRIADIGFVLLAIMALVLVIMVISVGFGSSV